MPACPRCKKIVKTPIQTFTHLNESDRKGGILEQTVGLYECSTCREKFPYVYGRQKLKLISTTELEKLQRALSDVKTENQTLQEKLGVTESEAAGLRFEVAELQKTVMAIGHNWMEGLRVDVDTLRQEKTKLEEEIARIAM
ncbi:MAG: hypothetical protein HY619_03225 [Thaumarchaeota archaeon]|nr:hypothetical protein [Nitrososphaerota archaeon]